MNDHNFPQDPYHNNEDVNIPLENANSSGESSSLVQSNPSSSNLLSQLPSTADVQNKLTGFFTDLSGSGKAAWNSFFNKPKNERYLVRISLTYDKNGKKITDSQEMQFSSQENALAYVNSMSDKLPLGTKVEILGPNMF